MTALGALRAAFADMGEHLWRLVLLNTALSVAVLPFVVAAAAAPLAFVLAAAVAGPLAMALMHCAVTLARTEELSLRCAPAGLRQGWRRGLVLGLALALTLGVGALAIAVYARSDAWPLAIVVVYLLIVFLSVQMMLWPLAAAEPSAPLRSLVRAAVVATLRRPRDTTVLTLLLAVVNVAAAVAALVPLLTLTVAYSFLAAAHFSLPRPASEEEAPA